MPTRTKEQTAAAVAADRRRRTNALVKNAAAIVEGERRCRATAKVRDAEGNPVIGPDGKALRRPCGNYAIRGGTVCTIHGGSTSAIKKRAKERLLALVEPSLVRLNELVQQEEHLPTALGAIRTVLERAGDEAIGALKQKAADAATQRPIVIGIKVGGIAQPTTVRVGMALPAGDDEPEAQEGEIVSDDGDDEGV